MTEIPIGHVGVVISFVGKPAVDVSGADFTHGNLVEVGGILTILQTRQNHSAIERLLQSLREKGFPATMPAKPTE